MKKSQNSKKTNFHGKKHSSKPRNTKERVSDNMASKDSSGEMPNNPYWYGATPELIRDTASLSYGYPVGRSVDMKNSDTTQASTPLSQSMLMPGVMAFGLVPTVGYSDSSNSPVNIASRNIYSWVRHANSGHTNYDAPDLMLYLLAMDSIYSLYAWGCRIYGLLGQYNHVNRYWPRAILETEHIDYDDFLSNMANFRAYLDMYAKKVGSMCVPAVMPYFDRHVQIYSQVYTDAPVLKAQMYLYTPHQFFEYNEYSGAGQLDAVVVPALTTTVPTKMTFAQFTAMADSLIDKVLASEDMNIMSGDILKAFGEGKLVKLNYVPIDYATPILYSPEMLSQIQNLTVCEYDLPSITQNVNTGALICTPSRTTTPIMDSVRILTMTHEEVLPLETIVATRLTNVPAYDGTVYHPDSIGSEYVRDVFLGYFNQQYQFAVGPIHDAVIPVDFNSPLLSMSYLNQVSMLEKFNQHPQFIIQLSTGAVTARMMDIDNYTLVEAEELREMNEAALLSMFNVPQLGMWNPASELNKS